MTTRNAAPPSSTTISREASGRVADARADGLIAGYRVVRRAADRHGGRVHTGQSDSGTLDSVEGGGAESAGDGGTAVSLVTFDRDPSGSHAMRLVEMLDRLAGPAVPGVLDVAHDAGHGPVVVLEFCGDTVASILADGTEVTAGEVVTIVAPILSAVVTLHERGYAHGGLSVVSIAIGAGGRPLLLGIERAVELVGDLRDRERAAGDDIRRIADVLSDLADAVRDPTGRRRVLEAADSIRSVAAAPFSAASRAAAEVRVFEIARPTALVLASPHERRAMEGRIVPRPAQNERRPRPGNDERPRLRFVAGLAAAVRERLGLPPGGRNPDPSGRRRRGPLVLGAAIVVATVLVLLLLPTDRKSSSGAAEPDATPRSASPGSDDAVATRGASVPPDGGSPAERAGETSETPDASDDDDVVVGARALLDGMSACAVSTSDACWASVVEPGSALSDELAASETPFDELPDALALPVDALELRPRDDYGDARVVLVTPTDGTRPASVLMIRTEAGWRVRDAFDA